mmetsp:Transcript_9789/g.16187  ORF Transcript_9789/g.16187 Transcript_9789/m.16187 type:complete len:281 (-) Transcript_9789:1454-2296(-)
MSVAHIVGRGSSIATSHSLVIISILVVSILVVVIAVSTISATTTLLVVISHISTTIAVVVMGGCAVWISSSLAHNLTVATELAELLAISVLHAVWVVVLAVHERRVRVLHARHSWGHGCVVVCTSVVVVTARSSTGVIGSACGALHHAVRSLLLSLVSCLSLWLLLIHSTPKIWCILELRHVTKSAWYTRRHSVHTHSTVLGHTRIHMTTQIITERLRLRLGFSLLGRFVFRLWGKSRVFQLRLKFVNKSRTSGDTRHRKPWRWASRRGLGSGRSSSLSG